MTPGRPSRPPFFFASWRRLPGATDTDFFERAGMMDTKALAQVAPAGVLAEQHRGKAKPGTARHRDRH